MFTTVLLDVSPLVLYKFPDFSGLPLKVQRTVFSETSKNLYNIKSHYIT